MAISDWIKNNTPIEQRTAAHHHTGPFPAFAGRCPPVPLGRAILPHPIPPKNSKAPRHGVNNDCATITMETKTETKMQARMTNRITQVFVLLLGLLPAHYASAQVAAITATDPSPLVEPTLDGAMLTVTLTGTTYASPLSFNSFSLNIEANTAGISVRTADRDSDTQATLTLTYAGPDFDDNIDIIVTVLASGHTGADSLTTGAVTAMAVIETSRLGTLTLSAGVLTPVFNAEIFVYTASVVNSVNSIAVTPTVAVGVDILVNSRRVNSGDASQEIMLNVGSPNIITVTVDDPLAPTQDYTITVTRAADAPDLMPTFGVAAIDPQTYTVGTAVFAILPMATGGDGALMYAITETLPDGLSFDGTSRALEGTPTMAQGVTTYTYTATDSDTTNPDTVELSFTIEVVAPVPTVGGDLIVNASNIVIDAAGNTVSGGTASGTLVVANVPSGVTPSHRVEVDATLGELTIDSVTGAWSYQIDNSRPDIRAQGPGDFAVDSGSVITTLGVLEITSTIRIVHNAGVYPDDPPTATAMVNGNAGGGTAEASTTVTLSGAGSDPEGNTITGYTWAQTGGATVVLAPNANTAEVTFTAPAAPETLTFTLVVVESIPFGPSQSSPALSVVVEITAASLGFGGETIPDQTYAIGTPTGTPITDLTLPAATGGMGPYSYDLSDMPSGLSFDGGTRVLSGTPDTVQVATTYTYTATDSATPPAMVTLEFTIEVAPALSFGAATIPDLTYEVGTVITPIVLPAATGGSPPLSYRISETSSAPLTDLGLSFNSDTRTLSGTPTATTGSPSLADTYSYVVTDSAGSFARLIIRLLIRPAPDLMPTFGTATINPQTYITGTAVSVTLPVATGGNGALMYAITETLPDGLSFDSDSRVLDGTPTTAQGVTSYTYTATDAASPPATGTLAFTIEVVASSNADLSALALSAGMLTPDFDSATLAYTAMVGNSVSSLTMTPTADDDGATITVDGVAVGSGAESGRIDLDVGDNAIDVVVTAEDSTTTVTYTVTVTRAVASGVASATFVTDPIALTETNLDGATMTVTLMNTEYVVSGSLNVDQFTLELDPAVPGLTVESLSRTDATNVVLTLAYAAGSDFDDNVLLFVDVLAAAHTGTELLTTAIVNVTVTAVVESTNANLSALLLSEGVLTPDFAPSTLAYTAMVANSVSSLTMTPTAEDAGASITVDGAAVDSSTASDPVDLDVGPNPIDVVVTAEDGAPTVTYMVTVTRATTAAPAVMIGVVNPFGGGPLSEENLDRTTVLFILSNTNFVASTSVIENAANYRVNGLPGLTIRAVSFFPPLPIGVPARVIIELAYDDTDFDADTAFTVTVLDAVHTGTGDLTTGTSIATAVTATVETSRLSALSLSEGMLTPPFGAGTFVYAASVVNSIDGLTVTPAAAVGTTITVDSTPVNSGAASAEIMLNPGANTITVAVTTPRAAAQDYTLTVTREQALTFGGTGTTGSVTEDAATTTATGTLTVTNPNMGGSTEVVAQTDTDGTYGMFSIVAATGAWTYTLNNANSATNALAAGEMVTDVFPVVAAADPGATTDVTITITGANAAPTAAITAPTGSPQVQFGTAVTLTGSGTDPDTGDSLAYAWTTNPPNTGSFADAAVASTTWTAPASGTGPVTLSLTVTDDATTPLSGTAQVTVNPVAEPIVITGANTGSVVEDATATASGTLTLSNPGSGGTDFVARTDVIGTYGTFSIVADTGAWTYALDNANSDTNALAAGATVDDVFTVAAAADPTVTEVVTITITGANDAPTAVISAPPANRTVFHGGQLAVVGSDSTDPDAGETASLSYTWSTTPASTGSFADSTAASTTWTAPATGASVILNLLVSDATASATATVTITLVAATANIDGNAAVNHLDGLVMYLSLNPVFRSLRGTERFRNELMGHLRTAAVGTTQELVGNAEAWRNAATTDSDVDGVDGVTHLDGLVIYLSLNPVFRSLRGTERFRDELMGHLRTTAVTTTQGLVDNANALLVP